MWVGLSGGFGEQLIQKLPCALVAQIELSNQHQFDLLRGELLIAGLLIAFF